MRSIGCSPGSTGSADVPVGSLAQQRYAQFVAEGINAESPWANLKGQVFLGDERFVTRMQKHIQTGKDDVQIPLAQQNQ